MEGFEWNINSLFPACPEIFKRIDIFVIKDQSKSEDIFPEVIYDDGEGGVSKIEPEKATCFILFDTYLLWNWIIVNTYLGRSGEFFFRFLRILIVCVFRVKVDNVAKVAEIELAEKEKMKDKVKNIILFRY